MKSLDQPITQDLIVQHGLSDEKCKKIVKAGAEFDRVGDVLVICGVRSVSE